MAEDKKEKGSGSGCITKPCDCINAYQDERYGKWQRVHNFTLKGKRCTVCGKNT